MKLVDILARELKVWPEGNYFAWQDYDREIRFSHTTRHDFHSSILADDHVRSRHGDDPDYGVTRVEWQAAVDALNAPKVVEWEQGDIPPIGEPCEAYVLAETENQGRPMNRWISGKFIGKALTDNGGIALLVECEDGWTHAINAFSYLRPVRTAEQVAAEEREKAAKERRKVMSEGYYENGQYIPWTPELILSEADAEVGPGCSDESYQKIRAIMAAAPDLLEALEALVACAPANGLLSVANARNAIARARGLSQ